MSGAISMELQFFLVSIMWGVIILIIYDGLRIFRRVVSHKWFFVAMEDVTFWVLSAFLIFRMMYEQNNGIIRGFSIIGMTLGMIVYNQSFSDFVVKGISGFFLFLNQCIGKVFRFLTKPIYVVGRFLRRPFRFLKNQLQKCGKFFLKGLKNRTKQDTITVEKKRAPKKKQKEKQKEKQNK